MLTAGNPLEPKFHNEARNGKREGLKNFRIGQSASKLPNRENVQRLDENRRTLESSKSTATIKG